MNWVCNEAYNHKVLLLYELTCHKVYEITLLCHLVSVTLVRYISNVRD